METVYMFSNSSITSLEGSLVNKLTKTFTSNARINAGNNS